MISPRLIAGCCLLWLLYAVAMATRVAEPGMPPAPRLPARPVQLWSADLAPIGPFDGFMVGTDPFMPWHLRQPSPNPGGSGADGVGTTGTGTVTGTGALPWPPARAAVEQPRCLGRVRHAVTGDEAVILRQGEAQLALRPGGEIGGWRLLAIRPGELRFRAPHGDEVSLPSAIR